MSENFSFFVVDGQLFTGHIGRDGQLKDLRPVEAYRAHQARDGAPDAADVWIIDLFTRGRPTTLHLVAPARLTGGLTGNVARGFTIPKGTKVFAWGDDDVVVEHDVVFPNLEATYTSPEERARRNQAEEERYRRRCAEREAGDKAVQARWALGGPGQIAKACEELVRDRPAMVRLLIREVIHGRRNGAVTAVIQRIVARLLADIDFGLAIPPDARELNRQFQLADHVRQYVRDHTRNGHWVQPKTT